MIVGYATGLDGIAHAVRWVDGVIEVISGDIPDAGATAITSDGRAILGAVYSPPSLFVWTEENGLKELPYFNGSANAIADVGLVFGGTVGTGQPYKQLAYRWGSRADCDRSATLTIDDFICFQTLFALGEVTADCDTDGVLTIDDFICFQTEFALGC